MDVPKTNEQKNPKSFYLSPNLLALVFRYPSKLLNTQCEVTFCMTCQYDTRSAI